jgi:hypothetical protein
MELELAIPPCISIPAHPLHFPSLDRPLRVQIAGPLASLMALLPDLKTTVDKGINSSFLPKALGLQFARMVYRKLYQREVQPEIVGDLELRNQFYSQTESG